MAIRHAHEKWRWAEYFYNQSAVLAERLLIVDIDTLPAKLIAEILGEGLLDQPVFAMNVGDHQLQPRNLGQCHG